MTVIMKIEYWNWKGLNDLGSYSDTVTSSSCDFGKIVWPHCASSVDWK